MPTEHNRKTLSPKKRQQREDRRDFIVFVLFILIIFSIGTVFGCFIHSILTPKTVTATEVQQQETVTVPEPEESTEDVPTFYTVEIKSENRTLDSELQATMVEMSEKYDVPFALVLAVAEQESRFNPDAESVTNDYGIMQINEINFGWLRERGIEPLEPKGNIEAGVLMLSEAIEKHGDYGLALMAYNCGDAGAKNLWNKGTYSTAYSRATMERFDKWNQYLGGS